MRGKTTLALTIVTCLAATSARAQEATPEASTQEGASTTEVAAPDAAEGGRFRFGINAAFGFESVTTNSTDISGTMFGADLRLGWQFSDLLAVYVQPHLSFGSLSTTNILAGTSVSGFTGTFVVTALGEVTVTESFFLGAGLGYGIFNNPSGVALHVRAGYYPLMFLGEDGKRRKGLALTFDFRPVFLDGATGLLYMFGVGYESF